MAATTNGSSDFSAVAAAGISPMKKGPIKLHRINNSHHNHPPRSGLPFPVPMSLYQNNRRRLRQRLQQLGASRKALVLMEGGKEEYRHESDTEKVFRQESSFMYLFGVKEPSFYATIAVQTGMTTLYMPRLPEEYAVWMGKIQPPEYFKEYYEVDRVLFVDELKSSILDFAPDVLYLNYGLNTDSGNYAKPASFPGLDEEVGQVCRIDKETMYQELAECRVIKSEEEIRILQYVNDISSDAHLEVMKHVRAGMSEYQLESLFLHHGYYYGGCRHVAYTSICGCGPNSAVLHYGHAGAPNDRTIQAQDMLLLDMGSEYCCYASDITCSFPASGSFSPDQRFIFECVQAMQFTVMDALQPGVAWIDMHELAYRTGCLKLKEGGLLVGEVEAMMAANVMATFMPHGLGHFMGLDVHDVGGYPTSTQVQQVVARDSRAGYRSLRAHRSMEVGMVITVEPGIYFIDILLDQALNDPVLSAFIDREVLARFRGFGGVRLEDDVVIVEGGIRNLTNCPRTVEDVEAVMHGKIQHRSQLKVKKFYKGEEI